MNFAVERTSERFSVHDSKLVPIETDHPREPFARTSARRGTAVGRHCVRRIFGDIPEYNIDVQGRRKQFGGKRDRLIRHAD